MAHRMFPTSGGYRFMIRLGLLLLVISLFATVTFFTIIWWLGIAFMLIGVYNRMA